MTAEPRLDAGPLRRALGTLADLLEASGNAERMATLSEIERLGIRAGVIKHFEMGTSCAGRWPRAGSTPTSPRASRRA